MIFYSADISSIMVIAAAPGGGGFPSVKSAIAVGFPASLDHLSLQIVFPSQLLFRSPHILLRKSPRPPEP